MTRYQRALQIWSLLVCAARDRRTYTYGDLADVLGMDGAGVMAQFLGPIMYYCREHQLPPLTVLVVNQNTGQPGPGLTTLENLDRDREKVFAHDWFQTKPPESGDLEEATRASSAAETSPAPTTTEPDHVTIHDFGKAASELERLCHLLREKCSITRAEFTPSGGEVGLAEHRFNLRPGLSVYVRAPITRTGRPRKWGCRWEFNTAERPTKKHYRDTAEEVADWICARKMEG